MKIPALLSVLAVLIALGGAVAYMGNIGNIRTGGDGSGIACSMEAKICPDGSAVGRTGPNCEFAACPQAATSTNGGGGGGILPYKSGIRGTVMLGPTCPVERIPPDPACAERGYETQISIFRASDNTRAVTTTGSNAQGVFEVSLPPGDYTVSARGGKMLPRCSPVTVSVSSNTYASVSVQCDTGIR